jgi:hypothetical protein
MSHSDVPVAQVERTAQSTIMVAVIAAVAGAAVFIASIPTGFGPLAVGIVVTGGALVLRRRPGQRVPAAYLLALGVAMTAVGVLLVLGLSSSVAPVQQAPSPIPAP